MALKRVEEPTAVEREFTFDFECFNITHRITSRGVHEEDALIRLQKNLESISSDIDDALYPDTQEAPKKKATAKKVVELKEAPVTVSNGIVFNQPKKVNDPGFQPKFREEIN